MHLVDWSGAAQEATMGVHDWTRVDAGTFHDFHTCWIAHLKKR